MALPLHRIVSLSSPKAITNIQPVVTTLPNNLGLELTTTNGRLTLNGVAVWALPDHITQSQTVAGSPFGTQQFNDIINICNTVKSWGGNLIRVRTLASDAAQGAGGPSGVSLATYVSMCQTIVTAATNAGLYTMFCDWDPSDSNVSGANWAGQANRANGPFTLWGQLVPAIGVNNPWVIYEPFNEPNNISWTQFQTNFQNTWTYFRNTLGYKGVLCADPINYANSGTGGGGYDNSNYLILENFDASLLGSAHQTMWAKHDYENDGYGGVWSDSAWQAGVGGTQNTHLIFETEVGNYNGAPPVLSWSQAAINDLTSKPATMTNYVGTVAFLMGAWVDANALTASDDKTTTTWGGYVQTAFSGAAPPGPPGPVNPPVIT